MSQGSADTASQYLSEEVEHLRSLVKSLSLRVADLEARAEFEVVRDSFSEGVKSEIEKRREEERVLAAGGLRPTAALPEVSPGSDRLKILQGIGKWIRRALNGSRSGPSGRDQLREASEVYLVCQSFSGVRFSPAKIFGSWRAAQKVVKQHHSLGESIFVGLPSAQDAEVVSIWAGLELSDQIIDG